MSERSAADILGVPARCHRAVIHVWSAQKFQTGVALTIAYIETGVEWIPPAFEAPTLHEALEAAVRAVAEATR